MIRNRIGFLLIITLISVIAIFILLSSCLNDSSSRQVVYLSGNNLSETGNIKSIVINSAKGLFSEPYIRGSVSNGTVSLTFSINGPDIFDFYSVGNPVFSYMVYISPGDKVNFTVIDGSPVFTGNNSDHYNFYSQINVDSLRYPMFTNNSKKYFARCQQVYQERLRIFESYIKKRRNLDDGYKSRFRDELQFEYLSKLIIPIKWNPQLDVDALKVFLGPISFEKFNREDLLGSHVFKTSLALYIRYSFADDRIAYSKNNLSKEVKFISENLHGSLKDFAFARLIFDYSNNLIPENIVEIRQLTDKIDLKTTSSPYLDEIIKVRARLNRLNKELPDSILNAKLIDIENKSLKNTFSGVLGKKQETIKVIDFWASWCKPCIDEIKKSYLFRKELTDKYNVEWIYFSTDTDINSWESRAHELQPYGLLNESYLISESNKEEMVKTFGLEWIPQYVVFDKDKKLVLDNLPKPSDSTLFKKIIEQIYFSNN